MGNNRDRKISPIDEQKLKQSGGQPLPADMKMRLEAEFRTSFDDIRVHTGQNARQITQKVGASSYTVGNHIVFAPGVYDPNTTKGRRLLQHELTHIVQQKPGKH